MPAICRKLTLLLDDIADDWYLLWEVKASWDGPSAPDRGCQWTAADPELFLADMRSLFDRGLVEFSVRTDQSFAPLADPSELFGDFAHWRYDPNGVWPRFNMGISRQGEAYLASID